MDLTNGLALRHGGSSRASTRAPSAHTSRAPSRSNVHLHAPGPFPRMPAGTEAGALAAEPSTAMSVGGLSVASTSAAAGGNRSVALAESVYDGVRARLRRLAEDVASRDAAIVALHKVCLLRSVQGGTACAMH